MMGVVDRAVDYLSERLDRRGFFGKAAVVGSAVVAAPLDFGLRPKSAYAAVCRCNGSSCACGSMCCDGYTEFCCTLNGRNACPPGTITAGWWKVDGSNFCGGAARYYLDCNAQCGGCGCGGDGVCAGACSGTGCGCAHGNCGNRKVGCTRFRYGQCNQHIRCVGPIVCRVVTCAPPWQFDPACGTSSRTDNATRWHDRPCLNEPTGVLDSVTDVGGAVRVTGWAVSNLDYGDAVIRLFIDTRVVVESVANKPRPDVQFGAPAFGPTTGFDFHYPAAPGKRLVCVFAVDRRNGRETFIGMKELTIRAPQGRVEQLTSLHHGRVRVQGWATDPANPGGTTLVRFLVDGREMHREFTSQPRPDVVRAYPGSYARSGFDVRVVSPPGRHTLCVEVVNRYGQVTRLSCHPVNMITRGNLERVVALGGGRVRVEGWATDPTRPGQRSTVRLTSDGAEVYRDVTSVVRTDVPHVVPNANARSGFSVELDLAPGSRSICADLVDSTGAISSIGCRTVDVAP